MPAHDAHRPHPDPEKSGPEKSGPEKSGPEQIAADLARQRVELGRTVDELAGRFDIREQAKRRGRDARARAREIVSGAGARMRGSGPGRHAPRLAPMDFLLPAVLLGAGITLIVVSRRR